MPLKCLLVDDDPLAIMVIESHLQRIPNVEIIGVFNNALTAYDVLLNNSIDLLILDIEMPEITGIDFVKSLFKPPMVIFTTANKDYAITGFELNAIDYIVKPVTFERLAKSMNKVIEIKKQRELSSVIQPIGESGFIFLKENKRNIKVFLKEIVYLESLKDYTKVITSEKTVITKQSISSFEEMLDGWQFIRVHKSFIVNIEHIDSYNQAEIEIGTTIIPIGRTYKDEVILKLDKKLL